MGTISRTVHGSRCQLFVSGQIVGIFNSVNYSVRYDATPIHILGRFSPAEIVLSGAEPVSVSATGWRVVDSGPYKVAGLSKLQDLLNNEDITLSIFDRQSGAEIMTVVGVRATGFSTSITNRGVQEVTVDFMGLRLSDEEDPNGQGEPGATQF